MLCLRERVTCYTFTMENDDFGQRPRRIEADGYSSYDGNMRSAQSSRRAYDARDVRGSRDAREGRDVQRGREGRDARGGRNTREERDAQRRRDTRGGYDAQRSREAREGRTSPRSSAAADSRSDRPARSTHSSYDARSSRSPQASRTGRSSASARTGSTARSSRTPRDERSARSASRGYARTTSAGNQNRTYKIIIVAAAVAILLILIFAISNCAGGGGNSAPAITADTSTATTTTTTTSTSSTADAQSSTGGNGAAATTGTESPSSENGSAATTDTQNRSDEHSAAASSATSATAKATIAAASAGASLASSFVSDSDIKEEELIDVIGEDEAAKLIERAKTDLDARWIAAHPDAYAFDGPEVQSKVLKLAADDALATSFVRDFPEEYYHEEPTDDASLALDTGSPSSDVPDTATPHIYQWDRRWGYTVYNADAFGLSGCGPTSLAMVYQGVTGKTDKTPYDMGELAYQGGYVVEWKGTSNGYFTYAADELGLICEEIPITLDSIATALANGKPIICNVGPGYFTSYGHFFVITGMSSDGRLIINDPYSSTRSSQLWDADLIVSEATALYAYSAA